MGKINQQIKDGIHISNAGLILLSPFLQSFFANLGLLSNEKFNSVPDAIKAVQILH